MVEVVMRRALVVLLLACGLALTAPDARAASSGTDSTITTGASFTIYPFFCLGGGHIHAPQFVQDTQGNLLNGYLRASLGGYIFSDTGPIRVRVFGATDSGAAVDTSGFTVPGGGSVTRIDPCDSVKVLSTGVGTKVTWRLFR